MPDQKIILNERKNPSIIFVQGMV